MKVYIVIVTYNPMQWIEKCFHSLRESLLPVSTIVIDNNSTDGSPQRIQTEYPEVDFIASETNLGFGAANNIGIKKAYEEGADFVFLLNQDAWIEPETLGQLVKSATNCPDFAILSPMHYTGAGDALDYNFSTFIAPEKCNGLLSDITVGNTLKEVYALSFVNAAGWLLTRKCVETVGGFNPSFFHYAEDINYCDRVIYHQLKIGIVPSTKLFHDRQQREISGYLTDSQTIFKRQLVRELSKPKLKKSLPYFYLLQLKYLLKALIKFDIELIQNTINNFGVLLKINLNQIQINRKQSLQKGLSFIEEHEN